MNLYDIEARYRAALDRLTEADAPPELIRDTLAAIEGEAEAALIALAGVLLERRAEADLIREAASRMGQRLQRAEARAQALEAALLGAMAAMDLPAVESPEYRVRRRASQPAVVVIDRTLVPAEYLGEPPSERQLDKAAIRRAFEAGQTVPGCRLERGQHLVIS